MPAQKLGSMPFQPWRARMVAASFRGAGFHVEHGAKSSGRRVALHEYPKRNLPYAEDLGRRAVRFDITAYLIGPNYLGARDALVKACDDDGSGMLIHPTLGSMKAMCERYTVTETRDKGGYCTFEMVFIEAGVAGNSQPTEATQDTVGAAADDNNDATAAAIDQVVDPGVEAPPAAETTNPGTAPFEPTDDQSQGINSGITF